MASIKVLDTINHGGYGKVERVKLPSGTIAARKVFDLLNPGITEDLKAVFKKRFRREIRAQKQFAQDYPEAFLAVLESDLEADPPWFIMPLADHSLMDLKSKKQDQTIIVRALADIMNGLDRLHALEYVHRDLKSANVLLHEGQWKLSDFGLVLPPAGASSTLSAPGGAWGTPEYAAPEQATGFHTVTPASDIYSFGCILHDFYGVGSRVPFDRHTAPGAIGRIIEKCTEKIPAKRFQSIAELRGVLLGHLAQPTASSGLPDAPEWIALLKDPDSITTEQISEFERFLNRPVTATDPMDRANELWRMLSVYQAIDEKALEAIYKKDPLTWKAVALAYCEWTHQSFDFDYCDVIIMRLKTIFSLGQLEVRSAAALAAARLGAYHNRWFVMHHVLDMCDPQLDSTLADRIALDIRIEGSEENFRACVKMISKTVEEYHPAITVVVKGGTKSG